MAEPRRIGLSSNRGGTDRSGEGPRKYLSSILHRRVLLRELSLARLAEILRLHGVALSDGSREEQVGHLLRTVEIGFPMARIGYAEVD